MRNVFTTGCARYLKIPLVLLLVGFSAIHAVAQCDVANALTVPSTYFNGGYAGNGNFNAIVFGSFATSDGLIGGRLAVGGNFTNTNVASENYFIGKAGFSPVSSDNLIVNGQLVNKLGGQITVRGNAKYGSLEAESTAPVHDAGEGSNSVSTNLINFTDLLTYYDNLSDSYAGIASTPGSSATELPIGVLNLTGNGTVQNYIFNITLGSPLLREVIFTNIPVGSGILINILNSGSLQLDGSEASGPMSTDYTNNTLFNFPNAQSILLNSFDFQGSVLMPSATTVSATNGTISGVFITGGSVTQATNFNILNSCLAFQPLPVTLTQFTAKKEGNTTLLSWQTTSDVNAVKFEVERSRGKNDNWQVIGERQVQQTTASTKFYSFTDATPLSKTNLYRLKMLDKDGSFAYSRLEEVYFENSQVKTYPNPAAEMVSFIAESGKKIQAVSATSLTGQSFPTQLINGTSVEIKNWPSGIYLFQLTTSDGVITTQRVIKN